MTRYAENTAVAIDKSRAEIEVTLSRYGATSFGYGWQEQKAMITFEAHGRRIRFILPMPDRNDKEFLQTCHEPPRKLSAGAAAERYEQVVRQRWRALALAIKAKLEAVASGIAEFEDEFMSQIVLPNGRTVGENMKPQIAQAYQSGKMPPLLGYAGDAARWSSAFLPIRKHYFEHYWRASERSGRKPNKLYSPERAAKTLSLLFAIECQSVKQAL